MPSSIFDNWRKELELWCPSLKVRTLDELIWSPNPPLCAPFTSFHDHLLTVIILTIWRSLGFITLYLIHRPSFFCQVLPYTGNQDERAQIRDEIMDENALENYNILISTYSQVRLYMSFFRPLHALVIHEDTNGNQQFVFFSR